MPQQSGGPSRVPSRRTLVAILVLVLAGGLVHLTVQPNIDSGNVTAADAARAELAEVLGPEASETAYVAPVGGTDAWETGTLAVPPTRAVNADVGADEPRVLLYVAHRQGSTWTAALEGSLDFVRLATRAQDVLAGTPSADLLATATSTGNGAASLSLPWATTETWRMTGGPHSYTGARTRPWSSLDFAGPTPGVSAKVHAARGGTVVRPCGNLVQIRHPDGWTTSYYHLKNIAVRAGASVARGAFLGYTSTAAGCGGAATGPHVHFSLLRNGSYVNLRDHAIGGWRIEDGSSQYEGCLVKDGVKKCAPRAAIYNDGSIGSD